MDTIDIHKDIAAIRNIPIVNSILEVVCRTTGMGFAAIARVTDKQWIACSVRDEISFGLLPGGELKLESTICHEIRQSGNSVIIDHVLNDPKFADHHTPAMYGFQSYISVPIIRKDGRFFGTLCAIDPRPAKLNNPETIAMFKLFAELIGFHLETVDKLALTEANLSKEKANAELREQFIAILGHDLRNPVGAAMSGAEFLLKTSKDEQTKKVAEIIRRSSSRISGLIDSMLDLAQGRLGGGLSLKKVENCEIGKMLEDVISELQTAWPDRIIKTDFKLRQAINCDTGRIAQLFSNLLGHALAHGSTGAAVIVTAISNNDQVELSVKNFGNPISDTDLPHLFQPFYRGQDKSGKNGLGLGLFISSEIARAHGGTLEVESNEIDTTFFLRFPCSEPDQLVLQEEV